MLLQHHQRRQQLPDYEDRYDSSTVAYRESVALNVTFSNAAGCIEGSWPVEAQGAGECGIGCKQARPAGYIIAVWTHIVI